MTPADVPTIDADRLFNNIARSAEIGRFRGTGLRRLALTPADKQMRDEFVAWARAAGCAHEDHASVTGADTSAVRLKDGAQACRWATTSAAAMSP